MKDVSGAEKCSFNVSATLLDCSDTTAKPGMREYSVFGEWDGGSWGPKTINAEPLEENRTFLPTSAALCINNH